MNTLVDVSSTTENSYRKGNAARSRIPKYKIDRNHSSSMKKICKQEKDKNRQQKQIRTVDRLSIPTVFLFSGRRALLEYQKHSLAQFDSSHTNPVSIN